MSKRIIRIAPALLFSELSESVGLELNAVLSSGKTYFGYLVVLTPEFLTVRDTRDHIHKLAISDLYEVVYDRESK